MESGKLKISVELTPEVSFDKETKQFIAKFEGLPTIAFDDTEEKAIFRLISIFEVFLQEQREMVYDRIIKKQIEQALEDSPSYQFIQIHRPDGERNQMKLQLVS